MKRAGRLSKWVLSLGLVATAPATAGDEDLRARTMGTLEYTALSVQFDRAPAREALASLSDAIAVPIVGRFADARDPNGLDPEAPVSLRFERAGARLVLEAIIEQVEVYEPCTWQIRTGFIEVGTKNRLSVRAASDTRVYPIRDLMIAPPLFIAPGLQGVGRQSPFAIATMLANPTLALDEFDAKPYSSAVISKPAELRPDKAGGFVARKNPNELAREIVQGIVEMVEPGNWDHGQFDPRDRAGRDKAARLRLMGDRIVVDAPGYIHRQIITPPAAPPPRLTDQDRADRAARAARENATIVLLPPATGGRR